MKLPSIALTLCFATSIASARGLGWDRIGEVLLTPASCSKGCGLKVPIQSKSPVFALSTNAIYGIVLSGRVNIECENGSKYNYFLLSPRTSGVFQKVPNGCANYALKSIEVVITSANFSSVDEKSGVRLSLFEPSS